MHWKRIYILSLASCLLAAGHARGQGTPAVLRCIFKGSVELHATLEPSSPVLAKIPCGNQLVLIDHRASSPHVRTKDGKDGYIISFNGGQWAVQSEVNDSLSSARAAPKIALNTDAPAEPPPTQPEAITLSNSDVVDLIKANVAPDVVIALIESSRTNFNTAPATLASLKTMSVPDPVVVAMVRAGSTVAAKPVNDRKRGDLSGIFKQLQSSVVTVWSEFGHGTGFIIDGSGLVLTNQHVVGPSVYIAVQFDATHKIPATLVAASPERDLAVLWTNLEALPGATVAPIRDTKEAATTVEGDGVLAIGSPINQRKVMTIGTVRRVESRTIVADINLNSENSGGPLINSAGVVIGITAFADAETAGRGISAIIRIEEAEPLIEDAHALISQLPPPPPQLLPVDPTDLFPIEEVRQIATSDKFDGKPYSVAMGDFELLMITPTLKYRMQTNASREKSKGNKSVSVQDARSFENYSGWTDYVSEYRPILQVRAMPDTDSVFGMLNRISKSSTAAAARQRFKKDFYGMRVVCGEREVQPIHPGKIAHIISQNSFFASTKDATYEGLYSYAADAISPACGQVRIEIYAERNREKPIVKVLDNKVVERIAEDFAPYLKSHP
jgi:putative serine protease PepD